MSSCLDKATKTLKTFYQNHPQPESLKSFENSFLIDYKSCNPYINSKKSIKKIFTTSSNHANNLSESSEPLSLRYMEKPARVEVEGGWESWLVDEKMHEGLMQDCIFGKAERSEDGNCWAYVAKVKPHKSKSIWHGGEGK